MGMDMASKLADIIHYFFVIQACRTALKKEAKGSKFEVVLHDGAPNIGGAWSNEAYTQVGRPRYPRETTSDYDVHLFN